MPCFELPHDHGTSENDLYLHRELQKEPAFLAAAEIFKQLSDPTRVRIFWLLCHQEACVMNIAAMLDMSSPAISHHLRSLTESGLIISRRDGKEVYYQSAKNEKGELLHKILETVMEIGCPGNSLSHVDSQEQVIFKVHQYLVAHIHERITIEELSRQFHMNSTTLKKTFKEVYGVSIAAHIKEHRMAKAAQLLSETPLSISSIARQTGYESQSRFTAAFRDFFGMTPMEFRKASREGVPLPKPETDCI